MAAVPVTSDSAILRRFADLADVKLNTTLTKAIDAHYRLAEEVVPAASAVRAGADAGKKETGLDQLEFRHGYSETLPISDDWADLVISNGVVNLSPDKDRVFKEIFRVLRPGGRIQIADITVEKEIPEGAKANIDLWTN